MNVFALHNINGELEASLDVLALERRIVVPNYRLCGDAIANQLQHGVNGNSSAGHARFSEMNFRTNLGPIHVANIHLMAPQRQGGFKHL
jgi:hypothetical protein